MPTFTGKLRTNDIFGALFNMIIGQYFTNDKFVTGYDLVNQHKVDGTLFGDTKNYYSVDVLPTEEWNDWSEAANLLAVKKPDAPYEQSIFISHTRMAWITTSKYLEKQAWMSEGVFGEFISNITAQVGNAKKNFESKLFNAFIGTDKSTKETCNISLTLPTKGTETNNRLRAQTIAQTLADLAVEMKDSTRDYNEIGYLRAYDMGSLEFIVNGKYANEITKIDLPTLFHTDGLSEITTKNILPAKYFGTVITKDGTTAANNTTVRSLLEMDYTVDDKKYHVLPGDLLPNNCAYKAKVTDGRGNVDNAVYTQDDKVICKIIDKNSVPFMDSFEVGTNFYNPRSLTENHYLIWGYSDLEHLQDYPFITISEA